jgi:DNA-binding MarR family transcriptional regulator
VSAEQNFDWTTIFKDRVPSTNLDMALLLVAVTRLRCLFDQDVQRSDQLEGLDKSEHHVLSTLRLAGRALSPTQLSQSIVQTTSGMTKTLRRLEKAGLVARIPDPGDGRRQLVRLTRDGTRFIERHSLQITALWEARFKQYNSAERARLTKAIRTLFAFAERCFPEIKPHRK